MVGVGFRGTNKDLMYLEKHMVCVEELILDEQWLIHEVCFCTK